MCIDEISQRQGQGDFVTVVGDIEGGELLEVIDSHKQDEIIEVLKQQPLEVRQQVQEVSVDMWGGFPKVVAELFTNARLVLDRFHVMKSVNQDLNKVRKQVEGKYTKKDNKTKGFGVGVAAHRLVQFCQVIEAGGGVGMVGSALGSPALALACASVRIARTTVRLRCSVPSTCTVLPD